MKVTQFGAVFGFLAAFLVVAGFIIPGNSPASDAPEQEWIQYIQDDEALLLVRAYLFIGAGLCAIGFYACGVRPLLSETGAADRALAGIGAGAAQAAAGALAVGGLVGAAVGAAHLIGDIPVDANLARLLENLYFGFLLVGSSVPFAVLMAVVAIQTRRQRRLPQWVAALSVISILGMAGSLILLPMVLLPVWLIATSVAVLRAGSETRNASQSLAMTTA